jgi:hypothetical protein
MATMSLKPLLRFTYNFALLFGFRFLVDGSVGDGTRHGIKQAFEHADGLRHLISVEFLDQFVGVLLVGGHDDILQLPSSLITKMRTGRTSAKNSTP